MVLHRNYCIWFAQQSETYVPKFSLIAPLIFLLVVGRRFIAEFLRRKFGLTFFFSKITASPDYDNYSKSDNEDRLSLRGKEVKEKIETNISVMVFL